MTLRIVFATLPQHVPHPPSDQSETIVRSKTYL